MIYLTKPLETKKLQLKNRLVFPPMATAKSDEKGHITEEILSYYDEKSKGGYLSLIIIEHSFIAKQGKASEKQLSIAEDEVVEDLKKLADVIHKNGSKAVMQINHAGSMTTAEVTGEETVAPSVILNPRRGELPRELSKEEIKEVVGRFANAAARVKAAGFDGVEIHSAHGYFLNQFYSPLTNKRNDEYGGDLLGRIKIHLEVIEAVKKAVGDDFPVLLRLGGSDYIDGGTTIKDSQIAAREFEKAGIDVLDISGGFCGYVVPGLSGQGYFAEITEAMKEAVSIPVILTGGVTEGSAAEELLSKGKADLIGVGRAIYNDSSWTRNTFEK